MYNSDLENIRRTAESALNRALSDPQYHSFVDTFQHILDEYTRVKMFLEEQQMENISKYYIVSVKHTQSDDPYITLWNPNNAGYCYRTEAAGQYDHETVVNMLGYYNNGDATLAIPCATINEITEEVEPGYLDETGNVIVNSEQHWLTILYNTITEPKNLPKPQANRR